MKCLPTNPFFLRPGNSHRCHTGLWWEAVSCTQVCPLNVQWILQRNVHHQPLQTPYWWVAALAILGSNNLLVFLRFICLYTPVASLPFHFHSLWNTYLCQHTYTQNEIKSKPAFLALASTSSCSCTRHADVAYYCMTLTPLCAGRQCTWRTWRARTWRLY